MKRSEAAKNRQQAKEALMPFYMGLDCKQKHGGKRYTSCGVCFQCAAIFSKKEWQLRRIKPLIWRGGFQV